MDLFMAVSAIYCTLLATSVTQAEQWRWPSDERSVMPGRELQEASVRIDNKVRFDDSAADRALYSDGAVSLPAADTTGSYNRPFADRTLVLNRASAAESQGTLDDLQYCRCERAPASNLQCRAGSQNSCNTHEYLCCSSPSPQNILHPEDMFNHIEERRPLSLGPQGPAGVIGPFSNLNTDSGESGSAQRAFFFPGRSSGFIDSRLSRPVLVGPGGPTGIIGPRGQGILVGPGGPTGIIGPRKQGVLVGPGGPTGVIGPAGLNRGYGESKPGILVGPGGLTGRVGPGRQVLVGPGGPTGHIGPRGSFGK